MEAVRVTAMAMAMAAAGASHRCKQCRRTSGRGAKGKGTSGMPSSVFTPVLACTQ